MYGEKSVPREFCPECEFSGLTKSGLSSPDCIIQLYFFIHNCSYACTMAIVSMYVQYANWFLLTSMFLLIYFNQKNVEIWLSIHVWITHNFINLAFDMFKMRPFWIFPSTCTCCGGCLPIVTYCSFLTCCTS